MDAAEVPAGQAGATLSVVGAERDEPEEIPYAIRWLVPRGERFANFDILNDNDSQLEYWRRHGHIYAVGIPTKKWRLVVVSDPDLLDEVAADEEQFGKRTEEINFFDQLQNSRGGGISVIGDSDDYERIRRVMLPWYSPEHQRTQLPRMKEQARGSSTAGDRSRTTSRSTRAPGWSGTPSRSRAAAPATTTSGCSREASRIPSRRRTCEHEGEHPACRRAAARLHAALRPRTAEAEARYRRQNKELFETADALVRGRMHTCPLGEQTDLLSRLVRRRIPRRASCSRPTRFATRS